jgi:hypothetical protein
MSLFPDGASFEELVQDYFLAHRGAGLMLSALDAELLARWSAQQIPFPVVARGIRRAAEKALWDARPGETGLRSLRACKRHVETEHQRHLRSVAGRGEDGAQPPKTSPEVARHRKMRRALAELAREEPSLAPTIERILATQLTTPPADLTEHEARETHIQLQLVRGLPFPERLALVREAREAMGESSVASVRARVLGRRFHLAAALGRRLATSLFW